MKCFIVKDQMEYLKAMRYETIKIWKNMKVSSERDFNIHQEHSNQLVVKLDNVVVEIPRVWGKVYSN